MSIKKVFITGVTGYIGGSIAHELLGKGYKVTGLVRQEKDIPAIKQTGIEPVHGSIDAIKLIHDCCQRADAVINCADADNPFIVATILDALNGSGKTFIHTSGSSIVGDKANGHKSDLIFTEDIPIEPLLEKEARVMMNTRILAAAKRGIRTMVIVPTMIYGEGMGIKKESIQLPMLTKLAKEKESGVYIGLGENIWSNVHIADLAALYRLALENAAAGSWFYAENGYASFKEMALAISHALGYKGKTMAIDIDEAIHHWGSEAAHYAIGSNSRVGAQKARTILGWQPQYDSILKSISVS
jgi:nucleoside-diphosphate-sugar epimerase